MQIRHSLAWCFLAQLLLSGYAVAESALEDRLPTWKFKIEFTSETGKVGEEGYESPSVRVAIEGSTEATQVMFLHQSHTGKELSQTVSEWKRLQPEKEGSQSFELSLHPGQTAEQLVKAELLVWTEKTGYRYELGEPKNQPQLKSLVTLEAWQVMINAEKARREATAIANSPAMRPSSSTSGLSSRRRLYPRSGNGAVSGSVSPDERQTAENFLKANPGFQVELEGGSGRAAKAQIEKGMQNSAFHNSAVVVIESRGVPSPEEIQTAMRRSPSVSSGARSNAAQGVYTMKQNDKGQWIVVVPNR